MSLDSIGSAGGGAAGVRAGRTSVAGGGAGAVCACTAAGAVIGCLCAQPTKIVTRHSITTHGSDLRIISISFQCPTGHGSAGRQGQNPVNPARAAERHGPATGRQEVYLKPYRLAI